MKRYGIGVLVAALLVWGSAAWAQSTTTSSSTSTTTTTLLSHAKPIVNIDVSDNFGRHMVKFVRITPSPDYKTGGEPLDIGPSPVNILTPTVCTAAKTPYECCTGNATALCNNSTGFGTSLDFGMCEPSQGGYIARINPATDVIQVFYSNSDASDGPLIEVPWGTDLDAQIFYCQLYGR